MVYGEPKPDEWKKLDLDDEYAAGMAYSRLVWLFQYDPFVALFGEDTYRRLANLIFSEGALGNSTINAKSAIAIRSDVYLALSESPMAMLLSNPFRDHIVELVQTAVLSGK